MKPSPTLAEANRFFDQTDNRFRVASEACERLVTAARKLVEAYQPIIHLLDRDRPVS